MSSDAPVPQRCPRCNHCCEVEIMKQLTQAATARMTEMENHFKTMSAKVDERFRVVYRSASVKHDNVVPSATSKILMQFTNEEAAKAGDKFDQVCVVALKHKPCAYFFDTTHAMNAKDPVFAQAELHIAFNSESDLAAFKSELRDQKEEEKATVKVKEAV